MNQKALIRQSILRYSQTEVMAAFDRLALEITQQFCDIQPLFLSVLTGGMIPTTYLITRLDFPLTLDYIHVSRYHNQTHPETLVWKAKPSTTLNNQTILLVDDVLDGGVTLAEIKKYCHNQGAKAVYTVVMVDKLRTRDPGGLNKADFTGLTTGNQYLFGSGMDYQGYLRNLPGIYAMPDLDQHGC